VSFPLPLNFPALRAGLVDSSENNGGSDNHNPSWNDFISHHTGISLNLLHGYHGYALLGAYISKFWGRDVQNSKKFFRIGLAIYLTCTLIMNILTFLHNTGHYSQGAESDEGLRGRKNLGAERYGEYLSPLVAVQSTGAFIFLMSIGDQVWEAWPTAISRVAEASFGTYLCHMIFLDGLKYFWEDYTQFLPRAIHVPIVTMSLLYFCTVFVVRLKRVPYLRIIF